jgi:LPS O-antigen subunit length determinant protein (WzzB/FepE family)
VNSRPFDVSQQRSDEIDLFELTQQLWREKTLIALITLAMTVMAAIYAFSTPPQFASRVVLSSAPIGLYGELMARMQDQKTVLQIEASPIALGRKLANDAFGLLGSNFESIRSRQQFIRGASDWQGISVTVTRDRKTSETLTLSATGPDPEAAQRFLNQYLAYVAEQTRSELNAYFNQSLSSDQLITSEMLYTLEQPAVVNSQPVKPRIPLILTLGFAVGGMLGVFVALVRSVLKKHRQRV